MNWKELKPYPANITTKVETKIFLKKNKLEISYRHSSEIALKKKSEKHKLFTRKNNLWKKTCFELFLANKNTDKYYELNFSLGNKWNCYSLDSYRSQLSESSDFALEQLCSNYIENSTEITINLNLTEKAIKFILDSECIINIAVVLEESNANNSFWTFNHLDNTPDFHNKKTYIASENLSIGV